MIIGHRKNIDFLETALAQNSLAHAYCFVGPDQVGKRTVAKHLAAKALKTEPDKLLTHPDFFYLEREVDEKKGRLKKDISIAQARTVNDFLRNRSWLGGVKAVVIDEAERINEEAANALLKMLEESVEHSLIFLLTTNAKELPATVRSRCQTMEFTLVSESEILAGLAELGHAEEISAKAASAAWGRPGRAIGLLNEEGALEEYESELARWKKINHSPFYIKLAAVEDLFGDKEDAIRGRDRLRKILDLWIMFWRSELLTRPEKNGAKKIASVIDSLRNAQQMLGANIHPRLLIEQVLLKI
ncbi:MAG: AAA family ATPase [Patescibacteria group bacterium]|nr:AAA family ATPase [Patescibacteria group bacterium]